MARATTTTRKRATAKRAAKRATTKTAATDAPKKPGARRAVKAAPKVEAPPPPPKPKTYNEIAQFAARLDDSFLLCRDMGHNWRPFGAQYTGDYYERVLRCARCRTERWQVMGNRGDVIRNNYKYPEGYQHKGYGRMEPHARDALRLESVLRAVGNRSETDES